MKTIFKNDEYQRVDNETADIKVKVNGWKFVPKSEWKANIRDLTKSEVKEIKKNRKNEKN